MTWTVREQLTIYVYGNIVGACNPTNWLRKRRGQIATAKQEAFAEMDLIQIYQCELESNLRCLQDCTQTDPVLKRDLQALRKIAE